MGAHAEEKHQLESLTADGLILVARKPYVAPRLIEYGSVKNLTRGSGNSPGDSGQSKGRQKNL